jgi:hypothetical protein
MRPSFAVDTPLMAGKRCTYSGIGAKTPPWCRSSTAKVALSVESAHPRQMAKTWVPKTDVKSARAFAKAMRPLLNPKGNRNQGHRPR